MSLLLFFIHTHKTPWPWVLKQRRKHVLGSSALRIHGAMVIP